MNLITFIRGFFFRNPSQMGDKVLGANDDQRYETRNIPDYQNDVSQFDGHTPDFSPLLEFQDHIDMFNEIREMLDTMFKSSFAVIITFPKDQIPCEKSPRSIMLKDEENRPSDSDFCKEIPHQDLIPYQDKGEPDIKPNCFSYSSVRTVYLPDGTVEEHRRVIESEGTTITTIRRVIGDSVHEIKTKSDLHGLKEKEENFLNMDENDIFKFEQKWKNVWSEDPTEPSLVIPPFNGCEPFEFEQQWKQEPAEPAAPSVGIPESNPSYWYLIKKKFRFI